MKTLSIHGLTTRYADTGHGAPVVLAHCSSASHRMWPALTEQLAEHVDAHATPFSAATERAAA